MESVGTALLKNKLSAYLKRVRKGARFIVTDRGEPVAKIVPLDSKEAITQEEKLAGLAAEGAITLPLFRSALKPHQKINLNRDIFSQSIIKERDLKR